MFARPVAPKSDLLSTRTRPMTNSRAFVSPPAELIERWVEESKSKPTIQAAYNYMAFKAAEWGFNSAIQPDPSSLKYRALKALDKIQALEVVSIWLGKDSFVTIRQALEKLPNH